MSIPKTLTIEITVEIKERMDDYSSGDWDAIKRTITPHLNAMSAEITALHSAEYDEIIIRRQVK